MGDDVPGDGTREPGERTALRWADSRTPFSWRGWSFGADTLRFGGNESPYPPPQQVLDAIAAAADRMNRYPFGMETALVKALSSRLECAPDQVMIAPGTSALVEAVIKGLGAPDREVVYPDSSYPAYRGAASAVRAQERPVPLRPDGSCDIDGLAAACTDRTSLVIVCNPNNPTGGMVPTTDLRPLIDALPAQTLLMIDEAYWEFTDEYAHGGRGALDYLDCGRPVLVTRTFSKFYGLAGLRVGYGVASRQIAGELQGRLRLGGANIVGLVAAATALDLTGVFAERADRIKAERERLRQAFAGLGFDPLPTQTNFVFCPHTGDDLAAKLMAAGYWVRDGRSVQMPGGMRVTVGNPDENDRLLAAIQAIAAPG
jgi:histidinol-phosphate aminotransferase